MPHVIRDLNGQVLGVFDRPTDGPSEELPDNDPEVLNFLSRQGVTSYFDLLRADLEFIRVMEDLIAVLMAKGVILLTDLPEQAQEKLLRRGSLRRQFRESAGMLDQDDDVL